jgi:hypothetical protein
MPPFLRIDTTRMNIVEDDKARISLIQRILADFDTWLAGTTPRPTLPAVRGEDGNRLCGERCSRPDTLGTGELARLKGRERKRNG